MNLGFEPVIATRVVAADLAVLRRLLSDPASYDGAACVRPSSSERVVAVRVRFGARRTLRYTWMLSPHRGTTEVDLAVQVESRGIAARLALLQTLSRDAVRAAEDLDGEPAPAMWLDAA